MIQSELRSNMQKINGNDLFVTLLIEYLAGSNKGQTSNGDLFNNPFKLGDVDANYTSQNLVETVSAAGEFKPAWTPVVGNKVTFIANDGTETELDVIDGKVTAPAEGRIKYVYNVYCSLIYKFNIIK